MQELFFFVNGSPAPQGSKRHVGRGVLIESSKRVKPWRAAIVAAVEGYEIRGYHPDEALTVHLHFVMPRPKATPKRARPFAKKKPDLDKLTRAVLDALTTARLMGDDARVVELYITKRIAELGERTGVHVRAWACANDALGARP